MCSIATVLKRQCRDTCYLAPYFRREKFRAPDNITLKIYDSDYINKCHNIVVLDISYYITQFKSHSYRISSQLLLVFLFAEMIVSALIDELNASRPELPSSYSNFLATKAMATLGWQARRTLIGGTYYVTTASPSLF